MTWITANPLWVQTSLFGASFFPQRSGINSQVLHFAFPSRPQLANLKIRHRNRAVKVCNNVWQNASVHAQPTSMPIWKVYTEKSINSFLTCRKKRLQTSFIMCHFLMVIQLKKMASLLFKEKNQDRIEFLPKTNLKTQTETYGYLRSEAERTYPPSSEDSDPWTLTSASIAVLISQVVNNLNWWAYKTKKIPYLLHGMVGSGFS